MANHIRTAPRWKLGAAVAAAVGALGAAALANEAAARRAESRYPPRGRFAEVDGTRLHYLEAGSGPPVVLLHGNGAMAEDFRASGLLDLLARKHRVIAPDRPGYGYSDRPYARIWTPENQAELLGGLLDQIGVENPIVLGHSWGTLVAISLALSRPVAGLVLLSGYYYPTARADVWLMSPPALPGLGDVLAYTVSPLVSRLILPKLIRTIFAPLPVPRRFRERFPLDLVLRPSQLQASAGESALMVPAAGRLEERYGELRMPLLIVAGEGDQIVDIRRQSRRLHEAITSSRFKIALGAGHMVHYAAAHGITAAIEDMGAG